MSREPRVYIPNKGSHDYGAAVKYGQLTFLTEGPLNRFATSTQYRVMAEQLRESTDQDYLLIAGPIVMNVIAASIMSRLHGKIRLLIFRAFERDYILRELMIDNLLEAMEEYEDAFNKAEMKEERIPKDVLPNRGNNKQTDNDQSG